VKDRGAAERFYTEVMGMELGRKRDDWTELSAGPLKFYLCDDDMAVCFALVADDPLSAAAHMEHDGCTRLFESGGEVFVRDPHGVNWCVSPRTP
jgi:hypothetical protein